MYTNGLGTIEPRHVNSATGSVLTYQTSRAGHLQRSARCVYSRGGESRTDWLQTLERDG